MHENGHVILFGDFGDFPDVRGVALDFELLFSNHNGASLEVLFEGFLHIGVIRDFIDAKAELIGECFGQLHGGFISQSMCGETIGAAVVGRGTIGNASSWQQDGFGGSQSLLVLP